tara:strand:- start:13674 stop:16991 length:3318 start_codon:yes stop_codon:yes gene_type:complete
MDAKLAERQLIDEDARAEPAMGNNGGSSKSTVNLVLGGKKSDPAQKQVHPATKDSPMRPAPSSALFPVRSFALNELQAYIDSPDSSQNLPVGPLNMTAPGRPASSSHDNEVPDSQIEPPTPTPTPNNALMSPPMTSSIAIPASEPGKKTRKKGKKRLRAEVDPSNILPEPVIVDDNANTMHGASETIAPSPLRSTRRRRQTYVNPEPELVETAPETTTGALSQVDELVISPQETTITTKSSRKKKGLLRRSAVLDPIEDDDIRDGRSLRVDQKVQLLKSTILRLGDEETINGQSQRVENMVKQLKKAKPRSDTSSANASITGSPSLSAVMDSNSEVGVDDTPLALEDARSAVEDTSPEVQDTFPEVQDTFPEVQDTFPEVQDTSPEVQDTSSQVHDTSPEVENASPEVEDGPMDIAPTQQAMEEALHVDLSTPPLVEEPLMTEHTLPTQEKPANGSSVQDPTTSTRSSGRGNKKRKAQLEVYDWPAPVRNLDKSPPSMPQETSSSEDEIPHVSSITTKTPTRGRTSKTLRKRRADATSHTTRPYYRYTRKSNVDNSLTAADRALLTVRQLHHPPDTRDGGAFTDDEQELIRRAIHDYQQRNNIETLELIDIIQWTDDSTDRTMKRPLSEWTEQELQARQESNDFWKEMKQIGLTRSFTRFKTHIRSRYHAFKMGEWTEEEDEQLQSLMELHHKKWKLISQIVGNRSLIDIYNRWRDYLQYGDNRNTSRWTEEEEELLIQAVATVKKRVEDHRAATGQPLLQGYTTADINWPQVAIEMGNVRSRLQCSVKWTRMMKPAEEISTVTDQNNELQKSVKRQRKARRSMAPGFHFVEHDAKSGKLVKKGRRASLSNDVENNGPKDNSQEEITELGSANASEQNAEKPALRIVEHMMQAGKVISKRRRGTQSYTAPPPRPRSDGQQEVPTTPAPKQPRSVRQAHTPGLSQMRTGDKFDLVMAIAPAIGALDNEEDVDWHEVAAKMKHSWSIRTLQAAVKELLNLVTDQGRFFDAVDHLLDYFTTHHTNEELKDYYNPYEDMDSDDGTPLLGEEEDRSEANLPNTKRKRMMSISRRSSKSRTSSAKRRKIKSVPSTPKAFKSNELVTTSDDE